MLPADLLEQRATDPTKPHQDQIDELHAGKEVLMTGLDRLVDLALPNHRRDRPFAGTLSNRDHVYVGLRQ